MRLFFSFLLAVLAVLAVLTTSAVQVQAQEPALRIAVVDLEAVFRAHPETIAAEKALEAQRQAARDAFVAKSNQLKEILQKHQETTKKLIEAGSGADAGLKETAETLLDEAAKVEKEVATLKTTQENDLKRGFLDAKEKILVSIREEITAFNADAGYGLIFDLSAKSSNGLPQLLGAPAATDITGAILKRVSE